MRNVLNLLKKDYILFFNDRLSVIFSFVIPIILIVIFGAVFNSSGTGGAKGIRLALVNMCDAPIAQKLEEALIKSDNFIIYKSITNAKGEQIILTEETLQENIKKGKARLGLVIPVDAVTDTSLGLKLKFYYDPRSDIEMGMAQGLLQQTILSQMPSLFMSNMQKQAVDALGSVNGGKFNRDIASMISNYFGVDTTDILHPDVSKWGQSLDTAAADTSSGGFSFFQNILNIEKIQLVGQEVKNPQATRNVGGWAMMFVLFSLTSGASSLFQEKSTGALLRVLSGPVSRLHILMSKYLYCMTLGLLQMFVLFIAGWLLQDIDIFSNFHNLIIVALMASASATAFGMLIAAISNTHAQANSLATLFILVMSALGGAWFPTFLMPGYIQVLSKFTIVYWAMEGFMKVLWVGDGFIQLIPELSVLLGISLFVNIFSVWRFKNGHILG